MPREKRNKMPREKRDERTATGGFRAADVRAAKRGYPPTHPPAPGEQGRRRASFFDRHRPSANRGSSDAKSTKGDIDTATPPTKAHARGSSDATSTMGAVDTATPPTKSHARGGRTAHLGQRETGVEDTPPAPQNVAPKPPPVGLLDAR